MNLPEIAIKNARFLILMVAVATVIGVQSFLHMPRAEDPQVNIPLYFVVAAYPGTSPEDMEQLVVNPLEEALSEVENIEEIKTTIEEGVVTIQILAPYDIDKDAKFDEILAAANKGKDELPDDIVYFDVHQFVPTDLTAIHLYALVSESASYQKMELEAELFKKDLESIDGVKQVDIEACPEEEIRVALDFQRMANQHIALQQVIGVLSANNINIPGGSVKASSKLFSIKTTGGYRSLQDIRQTIISSANGNIVYLKDIAAVDMGYKDRDWIARFNKENTIWVSVKMTKGANISKVSKGVKIAEKNFTATLAANMKLATVFEQALDVEKNIDSFFMNLLQGVALVGAIIFLFLGWRSAVIITTVIPLCVLIGMALLDSGGFALHQISVGALILALGLLVDNGIVVVENIQRYIGEGLPIREAAVKGTSEVGVAILSSTLTTFLAFFPLSQLGGGAGEFIQSLPITIILTLSISLILALTLSPILASKIMRKKAVEKPRRMDRWMQSLTVNIYRPALGFSLRYGKTMLVGAVILLVGSFSLFPKIGLAFLPEAEKPLLLIDIEMPEGTNIDRTDQAVRFVENILDKLDYVESYTGNAGHGNPMVYYNRIPANFKSHKGQLLVNFKYWDQQEFYDVQKKLRKAFRNYPNGQITFSPFKTGTHYDYKLEFLITGDDDDILKDLSYQIEDMFREVPGIIGVRNPINDRKTSLKFNLNKEKAGLVNLSYVNFDQTIRASLTGLKVGDATMNSGKEYPMMVRMAYNESPDVNDFNKVYFATPTGGQVPFRQVTDVEFESNKPTIWHYNTDRHTKVLANVEDPNAVVPLTQKIVNRLPEINLPPGYSIEVKGEYEEQQKTFGSLGGIMGIAMLGIFIVLILQFKSFLQPLAIFAAIPFAFTGSFIALYLSGWPFSVLPFVGFISLVGIVVNNSIIMVDYINQLRAKGMAKLEAIKMGSERRLIPILLTTITTIVGFIPLTASNSNVWTPLGWTIIGGLTSSTLMTLLIVPLLYKWFAGKET